MIIATSIEDAHIYGDIIPSIYRLRHQGFKVRQSYDVPYYKDMEYDSYDTPATSYLAWRDEAGVVRGCTRIFPTTRPYMIEEIWAEALENMRPPKSHRIWEASRFCIDRDLPIEQRRRIHGELLCGFQEFGIRHDVDWMIGVMTPPIWRFVFTNAGWPIEFLSKEYVLNPKEKILIGRMNISRNILNNVRTKFGIHNDVLFEQDNRFIKEAA